jgi:N-acetylglutamate synthase-like GNAT family acetyltransferase
MIESKQTSIKLPKEMLIKIKALAVEKEMTQNNIITELLAKSLNMNIKSKKKAKFINDRLPKLEGKAEDLEDLAGFIELDHETNSVDLKNSIHSNKSRL